MQTILCSALFTSVPYRDDNLPDDVVPKYWGSCGHKEDILCLAYCEPNVLVSASYDGDIIVWDVDGEKKLIRINAHDDMSRNGSQLAIQSHCIRKKSLNAMKCRMKKTNHETSSSFSITSKYSIPNNTISNSPTAGHLCQQPKKNLTTPFINRAPRRVTDAATVTNYNVSGIVGVQQCSGNWDKNNLSFTDRAVEKVSVHCDYRYIALYSYMYVIGYLWVLNYKEEMVC